jgi:hypothetical protein
VLGSQVTKGLRPLVTLQDDLEVGDHLVVQTLSGEQVGQGLLRGALHNGKDLVRLRLRMRNTMQVIGE